MISQQQPPHVVIIGAGPSGCASADALAARGVRVTLLESSERVGGRTLSVTLPHVAATVDLGGQWVGSKQATLLRVTSELGLSLRPQHHVGKRVLSLRGAPLATYTGLIPNASWGVLIDAQLTLLALDALRLLLWLFPAGCLSRWADGCSVAGFTAARMWTAGGRALVAIVVQGLFGHEPEDVSLLALARYVNGSGSVEAMSEVGPGTLQAHTVVGGMQQVSARLAARAVARGGVDVRLSHRCVALQQQQQPGCSGVIAVCANGERVEAHAAIVALPPPLARSIAFSPPLSPARDALMRGATMGCIIKSIAAYDRPFWREAGFSGEIIVETSREGAAPVFNVFDNTVSTSSGEVVPSLVCFINGARAAEWSARSPEERQRAVLAQLAECFGPHALTPLAYVEKDWVADEHTRGCPISSFAPGVLGAFGLARALREPSWPLAGGAHAIHWAGTETADLSCGFVDGALRAGEAAAAAVLADLQLGGSGSVGKGGAKAAPSSSSGGGGNGGGGAGVPRAFGADDPPLHNVSLLAV